MIRLDTFHTRRGWTVPGLALAALLILAHAGTAGKPETKDGVELTVQSDKVGVFDIFQAVVLVDEPAGENPFRDQWLSGVFTHVESGASIAVDGYCDSDNGTIFGIRFAPRYLGAYAYSIEYTDPFRSVTFEGSLTAVPSSNPGFLRLAEKNPYNFQWEKSRRHFFHQGHTAYHLANPILPESSWKGYIDHIVDLGFNKVRFLILCGRAQYWHYPIFPFTGDILTSTYDRYDVSVWRHYDAVLRYLVKKGVVASVIFEIEKDRIPDRFGGYHSPSERELQYYRYAIARLGAYHNVVWDMANEHNEYHAQSWANEMGPYMKAIDPYDHLLTVHGYAFFHYGSKDWADIVTLQAYPGGGATVINDDWHDLDAKVFGQRDYGKPVVNEEYGYEEPWPPDLVRKAHWGVVMSGGFATYGSFESMSVREGDLALFGTEEVPEQLEHLRDLFESIDYWMLEPRPDVIVETTGSFAWCRARYPSEYLVYLPEGGSVTLDLSMSAGLDLSIEWMDPCSGEIHPADPASTGGATELSLTAPLPDDAVLHIGRVVRNEAYEESFDEDDLSGWFLDGDWKRWRGRLVYRRPRFERAGGATPINRTFDNFHLEFDLEFGQGDPGDWAGVLLRAEDLGDFYHTDSGYLVTVYPTGWIAVLEARDSRQELIGDPVVADAWKPGESNRIEVLARGKEISVAVNGRPVLRAPVTRDYRSGHLTFVSSRGFVAFDDIVVSPLFFENFSDDIADGLTPYLGRWRVHDKAWLSHGAGRLDVCNVNAREYGEFVFSFEMQVLEEFPDGIAGIQFGAPDPEQSVGVDGLHLVLQPNRRRFYLIQVPGDDSSGSPPASILAMSPPLPSPFEEHSYRLEVDPHRIRLVSGDLVLIDYSNPDPVSIEGYVNLLTSGGVARFDSLYLHEPWGE